MAYRVGHQCFSDLSDANDFVLSQVQPVLVDDVWQRPQRTDQDWIYNGQVLSLDFPSCSWSDQIHDGALVGASFVVLFALMFGFRILYRLIYSVGASDDG